MVRPTGAGSSRAGRADRAAFAAGLVGYLTVAWMLRYVEHGRLAPFGVCRLCLAAVVWRMGRK